MPKYMDSLEKGIKAADLAEKSRKEIESVITDLNRQLHDGTDGVLEIVIDEYEKPKANPFEIEIWKPKETYYALTAKNKKFKTCKTKKLAIWETAWAGYPCTMTYSSKTIRCEDKESLEIALAEMLQDSMIAERISYIINYVEEKKE